MATTSTQTIEAPMDSKVSVNTPASTEEPTSVLQSMEIEDAPVNQAYETPDASAIKAKVFTSIYAVFLAGMNDAATGALIPYLQTSYDIGLLFVAIVYLINFSGFMVAAFSNVHITARIGQGGVLVLGATLQTIAYALNFWRPPYPLFVITFFFSGMGVAFQDAQANTLIANVNNAHRWLGLLHALYGAGALVSPLIATSLGAYTPYWHYFYLIMLGLAATNVGLLAWAFRQRLFKPISASAKDTATKELKQALSQRATWALSAFFFLYVGAEVTSGGWVVEFLIRVRGGEAGQVGYVASGFWGGLTLGRLVLAEPTHKLGERRMIFVYTALGLALQLMYWFIRNIIANAVFVSLLGFVIAPFFPVGLSVLTKILPRELHIAAIGFSATFGQAGSAAFPFLTGAVASRAGVIVLQPIMVGLLAGMAVLWMLMPRVKKPTQ